MAFSSGEISKSRAFVLFVEQQKKRVPQEAKRDTPLYEKTVSTESSIAAAWSKFGEGYISAEPILASQLTYLLMSRHLNKLRREANILSVGSGPGLYETYLANERCYESLYSADISHELLQVQRQLLVGKGHQEKYSPIPIEASMSALPMPDNTFQQVISINALQWVPNWRKAIQEMSRVLSPVFGSQLLLVASSASNFIDGRKVPVAGGMDEDTIFEEIEKNELYIRAVSRINLASGQFGIPTARLLCLAERGKRPAIADISERIVKTPNISFIDYHAKGGIVIAENHKTKKTERVI